MKVLIDYSWLRYRAKWAFKNIQCVKNQIKYNTGVIYGIWKSLQIILSNHKDAEVYLCLDGKPIKQENLSADYKAQREYEKNVDSIDIDYFILANNFTIIPQVSIAYHSNMEADESIAFLVDFLKGKDKVVIFSSDGDLRQLIDSENNIYCSKNENGVGGFELEDEVFLYRRGPKDLQGLIPKAIPLFKALRGDKSDNIKGLERFPIDLAKKIANYCISVESLEQLIARPETYNIKNIEQFKKILVNIKQVKNSYALAKIDPEYIPDIINISSNIDNNFWTYYSCDEIKNQIDYLIANDKNTINSNSN